MEKKENNYGLMSIQNRILVFALLITLIPSFGMGWLLNNMLHASVTEKIEQKLRHTSNIIEREIALWFKERKYDLYVFSNSFVISDNYSKYLNAPVNGENQDTVEPTNIRTIETYLMSVQNHFDDYTRLFILNKNGSIVASSHAVDKELKLRLPEDAIQQIENNKFMKGEVYFDEQKGIPLMLIGTPLFSEQYDEHVGILAIEVSIEGITGLLRTALLGVNWESQVSGSIIRLQDGRHFLSTDESENLKTPVISSDSVLRLFDEFAKLLDFVNHRGDRVVGLFTPLDNLKWGIVITERYQDVFLRVADSRKRITLAVCLLGMIIGLLAYLLARQIIIPLKALTQGAQQVAAGDLDVHLPVKYNDELGLATRIFNKMVAELNLSRTSLEIIATTDALTRLANRKQIMKELLNHFEYFRRYNTEFSILMIDVDHFKKINDTYGHQAGDVVLSDISEMFLETLRNVDSAGRYGGEEFLIILAESGEEVAQQVADRIRERVSKHDFIHGNHLIKVTVSVGVAKIIKMDESESSLIKRADNALYQAKRNGRNQICYLANDSAETSETGKIISIAGSAK